MRLAEAITMDISPGATGRVATSVPAGNPVIDDDETRVPRRPRESDAATPGVGTDAAAGGVVGRRPRRGVDADHGRALFTLKMVLGLQIDAMLIALGAAARAESEARAVEPWAKWVTEDLEFVVDLAASILEGNGDPATELVTGTAVPGPQAVERLAARYGSMTDLLAEMLADAGVNGPSRREASEVLDHCRARVAELACHRGATALVRSGTRIAESATTADLAG